MDASKKKNRTIAICLGVLILAAALGLSYLAARIFSAQYNTKGISNILCIWYDPDSPLEYVGELEEYSVYTEQMSTDDLYYTTYGGDTISLRETVEKDLVTVSDWRRGAWSRFMDGDTEILRYENYEIAINGRKCIIRPIPE